LTITTPPGARKSFSIGQPRSKLVALCRAQSPDRDPHQRPLSALVTQRTNGATAPWTLRASLDYC
jgi:hypothetical protein